MEDRDCRRKIHKIVITGGPCAGKTTGLIWIQNSFEKMGYTLLFMQEPATEMMSSGITPARCSSPMAYQQFQMKLQYEKEKVFERAAKDISDAIRERDAENGLAADPGKVLIVCDRGFFDNCAYMSKDEFRQVVRELGTTEEELLAGYDGVFHLETAAKKARFFYGNANNAVRSETPEEAVALDDRLIEAWSRHPDFHIIQNLSGFEDKMRHLIAKIASCLGEPVPAEIRRRFLIEYPDTKMLLSQEDCQLIVIEQTYLRAGENEEIRIRSQVTDEECMFYVTINRLSGGERRLDSERRLSSREYESLLKNADPEKRMLRKNRYRLNWKGKTFDIDLYPFWKDRAVLEVSLRRMDQKIEIPPFLKIRKDVTGDETYEISYLAKADAAAESE